METTSTQKKKLSTLRCSGTTICPHVRQLIYLSHYEGKECKEIALWFHIDISTVYRIIKDHSQSDASSRKKRNRVYNSPANFERERQLLHRQATVLGSDHLYMTPMKRNTTIGRPSAIPDGSAVGMIIRYIVTKYPHAYLDEIQEALKSIFGKKYSISCLSRYLTSRGFRVALGQRIIKLSNPQDRKYFFTKLPSIIHSLSQLIFVDETSHGKWTGYRKYGRSPKGTPVNLDFLPALQPSCCLMAAMTEKGVIGYSILLEPPKKIHFEHFLLKVVVPNSNHNSIVILDNARTHNYDNIQQILQPYGLQFLFLPAYSPDLNPIELWFSSYKKYWKRNNHLKTTPENVATAVKSTNQSCDWTKTIKHVYQQTNQGVICKKLK